MPVITIATETMGVVGETLPGRSGGPPAKAVADGTATVVLRAVVVPLVVGGAPEAKEGRLSTTPSRVHAVPVLGTEEEGGTPGGEVAALGADGRVAGGRRGLEGFPGRVAPGPTIVPRVATGAPQNAAPAVVAAQPALGRQAGRAQATAAAARVPGVAATPGVPAGHPAEGVARRRAPAGEALPAAAGSALLPLLLAATVVLPPPATVAAARPVPQAATRAWLAQAATTPRAPAVRQVAMGHGARPSRLVRTAVPLLS